MTINPDASETSRKTLDEIRREIETEYACTDPAQEAANDVADHQSRPGRSKPWTEAPPAEPAADEASSAPVGDFREIADRHERLLRSRDAVAEHRPSRSGYLLAGLVGCFAGQVLLLVFLAVASYVDWPPVPRAVKSTQPPGEAAAPTATRASVDASRGSPETLHSDVPSAFPSTPTESAPSSIETTPGSEGAAAAVPEQRAPSPPPPAIVSAAKLADETASRPADSLPPRVVPGSRSAPARQSTVLGAAARAVAQERLRAVFNQWLRASSGGASVQTTEPVIVLAPDGRTAKTYVSMTSPIGLIPREQRWELGPHGWTVVDDRQSGLPIPPPARTSRDR
jgi:hypothetical protein